ncbi:dihydropteroate synthase [Halomarina ordinaria]|uniref:Probable bifunctional folylpolyglutamate synthase/dihydropteroate synthase n=1 Tax=Halomarina ordinaria TaxID=3033939 RepID=A0ABD5UCG5_9EURY|nr:dihydropteroate synthase [Halomarina sp. PSRA2]
MKYHEAVASIHALQRRRPKFGTATTARLLSHLGDPHEDLDCVQVAGSNGKGSTARLLESVLRTSGVRVGLFTSPKLTDLREQVTVDGRPVARRDLATSVERLEPCIEALRAEDDAPTHFEVLTALALHHFARQDVDVAVLEVGIGGRYDATSVVSPVASAVTSVSLEHTDLLGDTVEAIARDKAQVAPEGRPLVTGATGAALDAVRGETDVLTVGERDADVVAVETGMRSAVESDVAVTGPDWALETQLSLLGRHQATNAGIAATLARQVADVDESTVADGLRRATWPGRFEVVEREPWVVLDGSHNPAATATLRDLLARYDYDDLHVVFGAMSDKDHAGMVEALPPVDTAFVTRPEVDRAASVDTLADVFEGHATHIEAVPSVPEATDRAVEAAAPTDFVLVTGSLYAVAEARDRWTRLVVPNDRTSPRPPLAGGRFPEVARETLDHRTFETRLRREQAERVAERLDALGGECVRSAVGAPEGLEAVALGGTVPCLRELAADLSGEGHGLGSVARQVDAALDPPPANPFGNDRRRTAVMGVLNVTPDSFHDGGEYDEFEAAVARARELVAAGADVVDVGGESTRPGADPVPVEEERSRVVPVVEAVSDLGVPVSVDTRRAAVASAALDAGASVVNDVSGLADPAMRFVVADHDAALVLTHSVSAPVDPDRRVTYDDVVDDVLRDLGERVLLAERAGVDRERIVVDPGLGFGKRAAESFELVDRLRAFRALGCPLLVGHSRKSMFDRVGCPGGERLPPTLAVTALAAERGVDVVRVHDVAENAAVVRTVAEARGQ